MLSIEHSLFIRSLTAAFVLLATAALLSGCDQTGFEGDNNSSPENAAVTVDDNPLSSQQNPNINTIPTDFSGRILHRGNGEEPDTLDPHLSEGVPAGNIIRDLFQGLTAETPAGEIIPGAANRWDVSRDGKTYTFYLRPEARWSNGDAVTASDFVFGLRRSTNPQTGSKYGHILAPILHAREVLSGTLPVEALGVKALNRHTVQIELHNPTSYFLTLLTHTSTFPMHQTSLEQAGAQHIPTGMLISNGAYQLREWRVQSRVVLDKNPHYWDTGNTRIGHVIYYPIVDAGAELNRFRAGELDWTFEVPNTQYDWLQNNYPEALVTEPWLGIYYLGFNLQQPPFEQAPALRKALNLAIDRQLLTEKVTRFGEIPSFNLVPRGMPDYAHAELDYAELSQQQRIEQARKLYRQSGYSDNNPLRVELRYNTNENHKKIALAVAAMWKQSLGVNTVLINEEWKVFLQNRSQARITELFRAGWIGDYQDAFSFLEIFHSEHGQNHTRYKNPSYDRLLTQISTERIPSRRARLMREAERILLADQPIIPLYTYVTKRLVSPQLKGWQPNIMDHHYSKDLYFAEQTAQLGG